MSWLAEVRDEIRHLRTALAAAQDDNVLLLERLRHACSLLAKRLGPDDHDARAWLQYTVRTFTDPLEGGEG